MPRLNIEDIRRAVSGSSRYIPQRTSVSSPSRPTTSPASSTTQPAISSGCIALIIVGVLFFIIVNVCVRIGTRNTITNPPPSQTARTGYVNTTNLNLRAGPGIKYSVLRVLPQGTQVIYLNQSQYADNATWVKVSIGSLEGWVNQKHLR